VYWTCFRYTQERLSFRRVFLQMPRSHQLRLRLHDVPKSCIFHKYASQIVICWRNMTSTVHCERWVESCCVVCVAHRTIVTSSGVGNLDDLEGGSVKHVRHYQVYRGMSPTTSSRLEVGLTCKHTAYNSVICGPRCRGGIKRCTVSVCSLRLICSK